MESGESDEEVTVTAAVVEVVTTGSEGVAVREDGEALMADVAMVSDKTVLASSSIRAGDSCSDTGDVSEDVTATVTVADVVKEGG